MRRSPSRPSDETNQVYLQITEIIEDEALWVPLCRTPQNMVMQAYIDGIEQDSYIPYIFTPNKITRV